MAKRIVLIILLTLAILGYFFLDDYNPHSEKAFQPLETTPIPLSDGDSIHFFYSGFAVTDGEDSRFYDYTGNPIKAPLKKGNGEIWNNPVAITDSTDHYVIINNKYLYNTAKIPFELILESPQDEAWDIKEFENNLLLVAKAEDDRLEPYIMQKSNNALYRIDGLADLSYIDSDYCPVSDAFSIITLDKDSPFPSTQILHFTDINVPYGVLSIDDEIFYKIYRYEDFVITMGLHDMRCYDMIGDLKWEEKIPNMLDHQVLTINKDIALYFNNVYIEDKNNTIVITKDGEYDFIALPRGLHHLTRYKSHYIGVLDKNTLVVLSSRGTIAEKYEMDTEIYGIYWTPYSPEKLFLDTGGEISIYSVASQKERSDDS